jgi:hypothetical protein
VVDEAIGVLDQPVGIHALDPLDDPGMKRSTTIVKQRAVGHLVSQRMLEGVFEIGEQLGFVNQFGCLQTRKSTPELVVFHL